MSVDACAYIGFGWIIDQNQKNQILLLLLIAFQDSLLQYNQPTVVMSWSLSQYPKDFL